jgi:hypothetical protein
LLAAFGKPERKIGDIKAVFADHLADRLLVHHLITRKTQHVVGVEFAGESSLRNAKQRQHGQGRNRSDKSCKPESYPDQHANRCGDPDRRRGCEAANRQPLLENHSRAQKPDTGHDTLGHSGRIGADRVVTDKRHPLILVDGDDHQDRRCDAHKRVGAKPGRTTVK